MKKRILLISCIFLITIVLTADQSIALSSNLSIEVSTKSEESLSDSRVCNYVKRGVTQIDSLNGLLTPKDDNNHYGYVGTGNNKMIMSSIFPQYSKNKPETTPQIVKAQSAQYRHIVVWWARPRRGCRSGAGICIIKLDDGPHCPNRFMLLFPFLSPINRNVRAVAKIESSQITFYLTTPPPERSGELVVDNDIPIDQCSSNSLGYDSYTILRGTYRITYPGSSFGQVTLSVESQPLDR